jgi:hypothetical protein
MLAINFSVYVAGCVLLLALYSLSGRSRADGELAPLLA